MRLRAPLLCAWAATSLVTLGVALYTGSIPAKRDWLIVSKSAFRKQNAKAGSYSAVLVSLSNAGPRTLQFHLPWVDCRSRDGSKVMSIESWTQIGGTGPAKLRPREKVQLCLKLCADPRFSEMPLFCCQIRWIEQQSTLYKLSRRLEQPVYWVGSVLGMEWNPPWRSRGFADGQVFVSNVKVADYFEQVYKLTLDRQLQEEELEREQARKIEQLQRTLPPGYA